MKVEESDRPTRSPYVWRLFSSLANLVYLKIRHCFSWHPTSGSALPPLCLNVSCLQYSTYGDSQTSFFPHHYFYFMSLHRSQSVDISGWKNCVVEVFCGIELAIFDRKCNKNFWGFPAFCLWKTLPIIKLNQCTPFLRRGCSLIGLGWR